MLTIAAFLNDLDQHFGSELRWLILAIAVAVVMWAMAKWDD